MKIKTPTKRELEELRQRLEQASMEYNAARFRYESAWNAIEWAKRHKTVCKQA